MAPAVERARRRMRRAMRDAAMVVFVGSAAGGVALSSSPGHADEVRPPPAASAASGAGAVPAAKAVAPKQPSVKQNIQNLAHEVTDPNTFQRIKAHEQEAESKVERTRDRQRKDHGTARPADAVDLAKSLDKPEGANAVPSAPKDKVAAKAGGVSPGPVGTEKKTAAPSSSLPATAPTATSGNVDVPSKETKQKHLGASPSAGGAKPTAPAPSAPAPASRP